MSLDESSAVPDVSKESSETSSNTSSPATEESSQPDESSREKPILDDGKEEQINEDYFDFLNRNFPDSDWSFEEISVRRYYGNYSGCEIVEMGSNLAHTDYVRYVKSLDILLNIQAVKRYMLTRIRSFIP